MLLSAMQAITGRLYSRLRLCRCKGSMACGYMRMERYFREQDQIHSGAEDTPDLSGEPVYQKMRLPIGYVRATDLYPVGTKVEVRMLEAEAGIRKNLKDFARTCIPKDSSFIPARQITRRTKIFVSWRDSYLLGVPGDWSKSRG